MALAPDRPRLPPGATRERLRLWLRLLRVTREVEAELRRRLAAEFDITLPRFDVMATLYSDPAGMKMSELSRRLKVSNGNVTGIIDRLVTERLVIRAVPDGDRRASVVTLTEAGRARFAAMASVHNRWIDELLAGLSADDAGTAAALIDRIAEKAAA
ncbi:MAG: MarR family transcriptional regulator [Rhizobiaceae bacterium]|nr:MarR family transcriptional regulator [Rhizobiaceae bacterium]MCV0404594.1 MarR family transcriptional regulator [Rhizobiaceae bacterium]